jgi:hypothetical protein
MFARIHSAEEMSSEERSEGKKPKVESDDLTIRFREEGYLGRRVVRAFLEVTADQ